MNSNAIRNKRTRSRKQSLIAASNNLVKNAKFSNDKSKIIKKIIIKAKSFMRANKQKGFLTNKLQKSSYDPTTRKKKRRLKLTNKHMIDTRRIIDCKKNTNQKIFKRKQIRNLPVNN
jgi:hypothetical protein